MSRRQAGAVPDDRRVAVRERTVLLVDRWMTLGQGSDHGRRRENQQDCHESPHRQSSFVRVTPIVAGFHPAPWRNRRPRPCGFA
jgi:hypothetical protein